MSDSENGPFGIIRSESSQLPSHKPENLNFKELEITESQIKRLQAEDGEVDDHNPAENENSKL